MTEPDAPLELMELLRAVERVRAASGFSYALIGGVARSAWATRRATADVDIIIDSPDPAAVLPFAAECGLIVNDDETRALAPALMCRLRLPSHPRGDVRIDVIAAGHAYYGRVLERAREVSVFGLAVRVAGPEDIILLKTLADRARDRDDIEAILRAQGDDLDHRLLRREMEALELEVPSWVKGYPPA